MLKNDLADFSSDADLERQLRCLPVEEPGDDLEERILASLFARQEAHAAYSAKRLSGGKYPKLGQLAVAASFLLVITLVALFAPSKNLLSEVASVYTPAHSNRAHTQAATSRPVHFVLHSGRSMPGAVIRIILPENVRLEGYASRQVLQWQTDIAVGSNRLSLPVKVLGDRDAGEILIEVEYGGASKRMRQRLTHL
ncbi:hypothetical protein ACCI51_11000 [Microbulbifer echini]|uniref:Uncharacterized protein n=1 Tax=Microbulbifer echini TaxID=1529067 RepID=A0ABV4NPX9_9GAMM|nr:hypothetical protein [uncultured Microbulbifer sp.]